jgi:hypothetical protein
MIALFKGQTLSTADQILDVPAHNVCTPTLRKSCLGQFKQQIHDVTAGC